MTMYTGDGPGAEDWGQPAAQPETADGAKSGIHWPTVLVSGAVAVVVATLIPGLVLFGVHVGEDHAAREPQPVVVSLASPEDSAASGVTVPDPAGAPSSAPAPSKPAAPKPGSSSQRGASGGSGGTSGGAAGTGGGAAPAVPEADSAAPEPAPAPEPAAAGPSTPDLGTLDGLLQQGLDPATDDATLASGLEGGAAAVPTVRAVANALNLVGAVYQWQLTGPVTLNDDVARAQLVTSMPGTAPTEATLKWYWMDGQWKLSNDSVCFLAHRAMTSCTVPGDPGGPHGHPL